MQIETFVHGPVQTNAFLVADEEANDAWVIDAPPGSAQEVLSAAAQPGWRVVALINTHGHWDHIADNAAIRDATGAPLSIHPADESMIQEPMQMGFARGDITPTNADAYLNGCIWGATPSPSGTRRGTRPVAWCSTSQQRARSSVAIPSSPKATGASIFPAQVRRRCTPRLPDSPHYHPKRSCTPVMGSLRLSARNGRG